MKYKKQLEYLKQKQNWFDKQNNNYKNSNTRPGSVKTK